MVTMIALCFDVYDYGFTVKLNSFGLVCQQQHLKRHLCCMVIHYPWCLLYKRISSSCCIYPLTYSIYCIRMGIRKAKNKHINTVISREGLPNVNHFKTAHVWGIDTNQQPYRAWVFMSTRIVFLKLNFSRLKICNRSTSYVLIIIVFFSNNYVSND